MEVKINVKGPAGCGKSQLIDDIIEMMRDTYGTCAVQTKDWKEDDHDVTIDVYMEDDD